MNEEEIKQQINNAKQPSNAPQSKNADSARRIIELALTDAESGKLEGVNDLFFASAKKVREFSEPEFLQIKARYGKIKGLLASDLNKATKIYKRSPNTGTGEDSQDKQGRMSKADMLIELVRAKGSFFHNADDEVFVSFQVDHIDKTTGEAEGLHFETWDIRSKGFKSWAAYLFFSTHNTTPGDTAISEAIDTLSGVGQFEGDEIEVNLRYGFHENKIYVDLGCEHWKIVEISTEGYKVIDTQHSPVKFVRNGMLRQLPQPERDGNLSLLWKHLNIESKDARILILAWLLEALRVNRPYPILEIGGEQGSAKSTFQKRLREIIDPNKVNLRSAPRSVEDIFISTRSNHVISYENLSHLTANTQDAFCIIALGGGDATRKLYSTNEEEAWEAMRPIMINGITQLATRPDLADRTIALELPKVEKYITEAELKESWEKDLPLILGALYDLMSKTIKCLPTVTIDKPPRMADFARLGQAMINAQGSDESFTEIYMRNRDRVVLRAVESSPVAQAIIRLIEKEVSFKGTKKRLMDRLVQYQPSYYDRANWPKSAKGLGDSLRRLAPALRVQGIEIIEDKKRYKDGYRLEVRQVENN